MAVKVPEPDLSTEEKIKSAARQVFTQKGYAATRTRDIAAVAGINLALLNYYFRSKEKLFQQIMMEKVQKLFGVIAPVINDSSTSLEMKTRQIVNNYIDMLIENPDLPLFVLSELKNNTEQFSVTIGLKQLILNTSLIFQLAERRPDINPAHFFINILSMTVFPFIVQPALSVTGVANRTEFDQLMQERKQLIPVWIESMLVKP